MMLYQFQVMSQSASLKELKAKSGFDKRNLSAYTVPMAQKRYYFKFDAPISILLVVASIAVYALNIFLMDKLQFPEGQTLIDSLFRCSSIDLKSPLDYVRLFSHVFGTDGWRNLLLNSFLLLLLGRSAEEGCGSLTLAVMLLLSALVSGVLTCLIPGLSSQGPDPLIFMLILLNFFICLSESNISCSWILLFLAYTALRSFNLIETVAPSSFSFMLKTCIPIFVALAAGIAGSLPAFLLMQKTGSRSPTRMKKVSKKKSKEKRQKNTGTLGETLIDDDETIVGTLDL